MANEKVSRRYAAAVFALAKEQNAVEAVGRDLARIDDAISTDEETRRFFVAPVIGAKEKTRVLTESFAGNSHELALHVLLLLVRKRREALLPELVTQYKILQMQDRGMEPVTITTAQPLSDEDLRKMVARLEQVFQKKFDVTQKVDSQLIGGVRIMMGDRRIDSSISGRLEDLSRTLFAKN
ncbi:MAG: ATP synthase F1 subunit delta [Candidatus Eremiobacteraeota bacterium]|nr:ATP synthase F1 subunit delta [Candidatus Eremiobacteraeota bacterium]